MTQEENWWTTPNPKLAAVVVTAFLVVCVALSVANGDTRSDGGKSEDVRMQGIVTVYDQRACAEGPMLRIHIGNRDVLPIKYDGSNAPCRLRVDHDIAEGEQYRFEVKPLPPVVRTADAMREPDGSLEVNISLYP